jgi:basic membrane lipoprotein Med (substrate-binding protein (PBP1-ABC) superfamily)
MNRKLYILVLFTLTIAMMLLVGPSSVKAVEPEVKVAFVLLWECGDNGWTAAACRGINEVKEYYLSQGGKLLEDKSNSYLIDLGGRHLQVVWVERAGDGPDSGRIMRDFAQRGFNLIFATTFGQMDFALEVAKEFPTLAVEHCSGYKTSTNMNWYFARMEDAEYVAGYVAGVMGYHRVGTVGTHPIPEPIRGINAFTLGLQRGLRESGHEDWASLPDLNTVVWLNSWRDAEGEVQAAQTFVDGGYDLVRQMADTPDSAKTACDEGVAAVGYGMDVRQFGASCALVSTTWRWGPYFIKTIEKVLANKWEGNKAFYGGFGANMIGLEGWNVPPEIREKALDMAAEFARRENEAREKGEDIASKIGIFCGPIRGQNGEILIKEGECWKDEDLLTRRVFVEGVKGYIPE